MRGGRLVLVGGAIACAAVVSGCGTNNFKDIKNVPNYHPDVLRNYENMDAHPNIGMVCIEGAGFATTTRSYNAITRVPEWDAICAAARK